ncbi:MAG: hypothetical protein FWG87_11610 [Defluviitaleaceae bacterium]|nr:hypothetical protein [Defluviitaleaceae bacterium]
MTWHFAVRAFGVAFCRSCVWRGILPFACSAWRFAVRVFGMTVTVGGGLVRPEVGTLVNSRTDNVH